MGEGWQTRRITADTAPQWFNGAFNVGVQLGSASKGLTDVDLDCSEAMTLAAYILPPTEAIFGRKSKPYSHGLYITNLALTRDAAALQFRDPRTKGMLVELRIGGGEKGAQTVFPGSVHEEGEPIEWAKDRNGTPATVDGDELEKQVRLLAACSLMTRYWPGEGGRHDAARVVGGFLSRAGIPRSFLKEYVGAVAKTAGDPDWKDRRKTAEDAATAHGAGKNTHGFPGMVDTFGKDVAEKVAEWIGYSGISDEPGADPQKNPAPNPIALTFFGDLDKPPMKSWAIKNVIALGETSSWIAPPGRGKSALLTDIGIHLAAGIDWRGYHTKGRRGVVYFALERADLVNRRLIAHKLRDGLPSDLPIAVSRKVISLMDAKSVPIIVDAIKVAEDRFGIPAGLVIFDTYSKAIAAGGGDEGLAKDQNIVIANQRRIIDQINIHIANIGHTGKDEKRGERGSNAHLADVDVQVQIGGDAVKTATVTKANDQPEDVLTGFRLEPYEFGADEDGDQFRTFILSKEILAGGATDDRRLSDRQRVALSALTEALLSHERSAPIEFGLPNGIKVVTAEQWRDELFRQRALDPEGSNPRARFNELRNSLKARSLIGARDDFVWLPT